MIKQLVAVILTLAINTVVITAPPEYITIRGERYSTALTSLNLRGIDLTDEEIVPLRYMTNLQYLSLGNNEITDIIPLADLENLMSLWLHNNQITDWSPVAHIQNVWGRP
jgi:internalin A